MRHPRDTGKTRRRSAGKVSIVKSEDLRRDVFRRVYNVARAFQRLSAEAALTSMGDVTIDETRPRTEDAPRRSIEVQN